MSEADDALREMAANRGCKLVKSRRRKPGGDFGRYGLKDAKSGKELLGFGGKGLSASADEIRVFLRSGETAGWKRSLIAPVDKATPVSRRKAAPPPPPPPASRRKAEAPTREAPKRASQAKRKREAEPEAPPPPAVREARPADAAAIAGLLDQLGYDVVAADVRKRLAALRRNDEPVLVAARGKALIGCLSWHVTPVIHRPRPVGRITMLVVAEAERGAGVGKLLVGAAEARLRQRGCGLLEVTSNIKRMRAHAFYTGLGFERTSYRFGKPLAD